MVDINIPNVSESNPIWRLWWVLLDTNLSPFAKSTTKKAQSNLVNRTKPTRLELTQGLEDIDIPDVSESNPIWGLRRFFLAKNYHRKGSI